MERIPEWLSWSSLGGLLTGGAALFAAWRSRTRGKPKPESAETIAIRVAKWLQANKRVFYLEGGAEIEREAFADLMEDFARIQHDNRWLRDELVRLQRENAALRDGGNGSDTGSTASLTAKSRAFRERKRRSSTTSDEPSATSNDSGEPITRSSIT